MKSACEACGLDLPWNAVAYACSYDCTFCPSCASNLREVCSHCGGELVRRPRRAEVVEGGQKIATSRNGGFSFWMVWVLSFAVWGFIAVAYSASVYELYRSGGSPMGFATVLAMQCTQVLAYALLTPFAFEFANRYPVQRNNWGRRSLVLLAGGTVFALGHVLLRGLMPYGVWDPQLRRFVSAVWDYQGHRFQIHWVMYERLFFSNVVDDIVTTYFAIVLIAHVASYYQGLRERGLRTSQLQAQLEKARLQALKSQLQPHFLFNTLNSISALMLTDVQAADRMIVRLGDLLRITLETAGTQMTTLSRELEFINCYVEIEKVRFQERLRVIVDVDPNTLDASVPHLLLQPLVDNAIKHGIAKMTVGGEIRISAIRNNGDLHLEVRDNGPGLRESNRSATGGVGLRITRERLETIYGQNQSVQLTTPLEGGTLARVSLPLHVADRDK